MDLRAQSMNDDAGPDATPAAWFALAILMLVGLYAFVDRQVFVLQAEPIRQQMLLSDLQIGLLQGLGVALFASIAGYPIGWLADRFDRRVVLSGCIVVWSLAVAACGLARDFSELFIASALVGAGEAGFTPIAYALIPELFRNRKRMLANSIFIVAGRVGVGLATAMCGYIIQGVEWARPWLPTTLQGIEGWRLAFMAAALPGPLFVILMLSISIRRRGAADPTPMRPIARERSAPPSRVLEFMLPQKATFISFFLGMGFAVVGISALASWLPIAAMRQFGATPVEVGNAMGLATMASTVLGMAFTVFATRALGPRLGTLMPLVVLRWSMLLGALTVLVLPWCGSSVQVFVVFGATMTVVMAGMMVYPTALQDFTPRSLRARIIALLTVVLFLFSAASPPVVGLISDLLKAHPHGLLLAVTGFAVASLLLAAVLLWRCGPHYVSTVRSASAFDAAEILAQSPGKSGTIAPAAG